MIIFTGIITAIGTVTASEMKGDLHVTISCPYDPAGIAIGASIACNGACMTVVDKGGQEGDAWFRITVSAESLAKTAGDNWAAGKRLNLERALKIGDELGGHIVTGHVDEVGVIAALATEGESTRLTIAASAAIAPYIAPKGSVTVNGVSLTVNAVEDVAEGVRFGLNIIPHTAGATTLGALLEGDKVNLEIDTIARYLHRMQGMRT